MRIGVMLRHLRDQRGGIGTLTRNLLENLLEIDAENEYVLIYGHDELIGTYTSHSRVSELVAKAPSKLIWDQVLVPYLARKHHLDLIFNPKLSVPVAAKCTKIFVMAGGDWFVFPQNYKLHDRVYHRIFAPLYFRAATAVISISHSATADILRSVKVHPAKLHTIHLAANSSFRPIDDQRELRRVKEKYHLPERYILWVGQIYPMKNVGRLLQAYSILRATLPHKLVLVGKRELKYEKELSLIQELRLEDEVILTGWIPDDDLPAFYNLADLFVFPSLYEGFGIPVLEAMACGCPVVTSERGATEEIARGAAVLVNPTDVDSIYAGMRKCLVDHELTEELVRRGFERALSFSWVRCAEETINLFNSFRPA